MIGSLSLRIVGDPVHLTTARSYAGAIARVLDLDEKTRHDIRLAVSELATLLIRSGVPEVTILAEVDSDTPLLRLQAHGTTPPIPAETAGLLTAIGRGLWSIDQPWVVRLGTPISS
ncbi:MAG TPA: hypothetical protein VJQ79_04345 [Acidimicrobiia bacterium]|nr:hypothetical protein [Acidimicrobiia bacterium]